MCRKFSKRISKNQPFASSLLILMSQLIHLMNNRAMSAVESLRKNWKKTLHREAVQPELPQVGDIIQNVAMLMAGHPYAGVIPDRRRGRQQDDFCSGGKKLGLSDELTPDPLLLI